MKEKYIHFLRRTALLWLLAGLSVLTIEILSRGVVEAFAFVGAQPLTFIVNVNRMALMTVPALFFKKGVFVACLIQLPWLVAAMANRIMMIVRGTPFIWADLQSAGEGVTLAGQYLTWGMLLQIGLFVGVVVSVLIVSYKRYTHHTKLKPVERLAGVVVVAMAILSIQWVCGLGDVMAQGEENVELLYGRNGFLYTFTSDMAKFFGGEEEVEVPEEVLQALQQTAQAETDVPQVPNSSDGMDNDAADREEGASEEAVGRRPNIIVVQMESSFDPYVLEGVTYSQNPVPNVHKYMNEGYSGPLGVHTFAGGTARTEFEFLAAMNMDFISGGIPYTDGTITDQPIETIAYLLKDRGYFTTAIHNHLGAFFDRSGIYDNLGFDRFIPKEMMHPLEHEYGWAKDEVMVDYIQRAIEATEEADFVFAVTAAMHGPYPMEHDGLKYGIEIQGVPEGEAKAQYEKYIDRLHHLDKLMGEIIQYVESLEEDTILVIYSDHGPNLEVLRDWTREEKFITYYAIIDNQGLLPTQQDQHLQAYQLYPKLFEMLGFEEGMMNGVHQKYVEDPEYDTYFKGVQQIVLKGLKDLEPTNMQIGMEPVRIVEIHDTEKGLEIGGDGFTTYSKVFLNDKLLKTTFVSQQKLLVEGQKKVKGSYTVGQVGMEDKVLLASDVFKVEREK
ncbi:MAG: LTA synthase family protein [Cellulosilyticaceae bacterium]